MDIKKKHLSPIFGAAGIASKSIRRFYEAIKQQNSDEKTATERLIFSLFNLIGNEFRATQKKTAAAYSLTPVILAKLIYQIDAGILNEHELMNDLSNEWKAKHTRMTGNNLSTQHLSTLLKDII
jgi:hypothetical protein